MKRIKFLLGLILLILSLIPNSPVYADTTSSIPPELRQGNFSCDKTTIQTALDLKHAGWTYIMPQPKSPQAAWGNHDGRTTWYVGYWTNSNTRQTSSIQPVKNEQGQLIGDGKGIPAWRRGGSPPLPTKIEWLCSAAGGASTN